jgi:hypothetical protein
MHKPKMLQSLPFGQAGLPWNMSQIRRQTAPEQ